MDKQTEMKPLANRRKVWLTSVLTPIFFSILGTAFEHQNTTDASDSEDLMCPCEDLTFCTCRLTHSSNFARQTKRKAERSGVKGSCQREVFICQCFAEVLTSLVTVKLGLSSDSALISVYTGTAIGQLTFKRTCTHTHTPVLNTHNSVFLNPCNAENGTSSSSVKDYI